MDDKHLIFEFDDVRVEPHELKAFKSGEAVALEPKAFAALLFLLEHRGRIVEKDELLDAVWGDAFVTPNAMTRVIAQLRKGLGDDAREAKYIETVPTRGYRFIAKVSESDVETRSRLRTAGNEAAANGWHNDRISESDVTNRTVPSAIKVARVPHTIVLTLLCAIALLSLTAILFWKNRPATNPPALVTIAKTTQLTASPGLDLHPTFSPDGNSIAYASDRGGGFEIYARSLIPGGREIQITSDGAQNFQPAWSPDGKFIAFHSRERGGLWLVPALGGVAQQLTEFGSHPAWSPDGTWLAFQSYALPDLSQSAYGAMPPSTLWKVAVQGGAPQTITQKGQPSGGHGAPAWSPDGRRILFVTWDIMFSEVWSVAIDGSDLKRVLDGEAVFYDPVYAPDGQSFYLAVGTGNFWIWKVPLNQNGLPSDEPLRLANTGATLARRLSISPDGNRLVYSAMTMTNNIGSVMLSPTTHEAASAPTLLTQDTNYRKTTQMFSPDGSRIAYNVWRMGNEGEAMVMNADGSHARVITASPAALLGWLPGGQQLAIVPKATAERRLLAVDLNNGRQISLSAHRVERGLGRLSPDGRQIAFNSRASGTINVWLASVETGTRRQLTFDQEMIGYPCWSPDGKQLAVEMKRGDDTHLAVIPSEGGAPEQLTTERGQHWPGSWSADGDRIAFASQRKGVWNVWWVSRRDKTQKQITNYSAPNTYVRSPAWSPRGNQIVYEFAETRGNVWVMELK